MKRIFVVLIIFVLTQYGDSIRLIRSPQFTIVLPEETAETLPPPEAPPRATIIPTDPECYNKCPKIQQYNPVCGSDGVTYINMQYVRCAQACGTGK